jgi:hypothetical protein
MKVKFFTLAFFMGIIFFNLFAQTNSTLNNNFDSFSTNNSFDNFDFTPLDNNFNSQPFDNSFNQQINSNFSNQPFDQSLNQQFDNNFSNKSFDNSFNQQFDNNFSNQSFGGQLDQSSLNNQKFQTDFSSTPISCSAEVKQQLNEQLINVYQILEDLKVIVQTQESIEDKKNTSRFLRNQLKELIEKIKLNEMVKANPKFLANYFDTVLQNYQKFDDFFDITNLNNLYDAFKTIKLNLGLDLSTLSAFLPN